MQTKLSETTATGGFGTPVGRKLLKVQTGKYAGKMIALYKVSNNEIKYCFSNYPYDSWSSLVSIVTDSTNDAIDVVMNDTGDVYLVYCEVTTNYLVSVKLSITDTGWDVGSKVYVYNAGIAKTPSITIDVSGNLYVSFSMYSASAFNLHVKTSTDDALTWGSSPSDDGEIISVAYSMAVPKIMTSDNELFVVYVTNWNAVRERSRLLSGTSWTTEYTIASSANIDHHFDATVLPGGFIGVVYDDNQLNYREFDGSNWSPITVLDTSESFFPQISLVNNVPIILFLSEFSSGQFQMMQTNRLTGSFSVPIVLENRASTFDSLIIYDNNSSSYEEKTIEAANAITGDMFHSVSSVLCSTIADKIYCGSDLKFRFIRMLLSSAGNGGLVTFAYYDGTNWNSFIPSSGAYHLDSLDKEILLFDDFDSSPQDWQKNYVNGINRFWIKIETTSAFTTAPIGSQFTSISNQNAISVRR